MSTDNATKPEHIAITHNRGAWEEIARSHDEQRLADVSAHLAAQPSHYLEQPLREILVEIGLDDKVVAQFNCNNGRELISIVNAGARAGIGFDISSEYVKQAKSLAQQYCPAADFVVRDVTSVEESYKDAADILVVTASAMCWLPDLSDYFSSAARVLRPGGSLILYETHPFAEMFEADIERADDKPLTPVYAYNSREPVIFKSEGAYFGDGNTGSTYWHHHSLSYIIQSALDAGFVLRSFAEYSHDVCVGYRELEKVSVHPPLSMRVHFELVPR